MITDGAEVRSVAAAPQKHPDAHRESDEAPPDQNAGRAFVAPVWGRGLLKGLRARPSVHGVALFVGVSHPLVKYLNQPRVREAPARFHLAGCKNNSIFGLLGPNGADKTTLRMMMTLIEPDSGTICVLGLATLRDPLEVRRRIAVVLQDNAAELFLTVCDTPDSSGRRNTSSLV